MAKKKSGGHDSNGQIKKKFHVKDLRKIKPMTENQTKLFDTWNW